MLADAPDGDAAALAAIAVSSEVLRVRANSALTVNPAVRERLQEATMPMELRSPQYAIRKTIQARALGWPLSPTTTIGSFPQTAAARKVRAANRTGKLSDIDHHAFLREETEPTVRFQEELDIDVLVHGEFERSGMVKYFGKQLAGFAFTHPDWVQSYGLRCVKPPITYGDVARPLPMTVEWRATCNH